MNKMTLTELLLYLDVLSYFPEFSHGSYRKAGEFIDDYLATPPEERPRTMFSAYRPDEVTGVTSLLQRLSKCERIRSMKVVYDSSDSDMFNSVCLAEDSFDKGGNIGKRRIYIIIGTNYRTGEYLSPYAKTCSWSDNFLGAVQDETIEQKCIVSFYEKALREALSDKHITRNTKTEMIVSGHSKGGNLAQYLTIIKDEIDKCYSFDGEGFSKRTLRKYHDRISRNSRKIISVYPDMSIVGNLLYPVPDTERRFIRTGWLCDPEMPKFPLSCHVPTALLDSGFRLKPYTNGFLPASDLLHFISVTTPSSAERIPFINAEKGLSQIGRGIMHIFKDRIFKGLKCLANKDSALLIILGSLITSAAAPVYLAASMILRIQKRRNNT